MSAPRKARVWSTEDCSMCEKVLRHLIAGEFIIEKIDANKLISGEEPDMDAMVQLTLQGMSLPIVEIDDNFVNPGDLIDE